MFIGRPMRLWQIPFSTNVERVALALAHKGLDAEPVLVDPADRGPIRALSGQDLVPVLEDGDLVVADSLRIVAHLEERHPEAPLYPSDPTRREEVRIFLDWFDRVWKVAPNRLADAVMDGRDTDDPRTGTWIQELRGSLDRFDALLQDRDFLLGDTFGVADLAVFPFLKYGVVLNDEDDEVFHRILVEHLRPAARHHRLRAWIDRVEELPRAGLASVAPDTARPQS
jgi:glutathione S-transferase